MIKTIDSRLGGSFGHLSRGAKRRRRSDIAIDRPKTGEKKRKGSLKLDDFKSKVLCPCIFPHCIRMRESYSQLIDSKGKSALLENQNSLLEELKGCKKIKLNTTVELFYHSDSLLEHIEENTTTKGHIEGCNFQKGSDLEALSVYMLSENDDIVNKQTDF